MDCFIERLVEWYLSIKDEVYDKEDTFYVEGDNVKIPFHYVENICDNYIGEKEHAKTMEELHYKECLFNDLLIEKLKGGD